MKISPAALVPLLAATAFISPQVAWAATSSWTAVQVSTSPGSTKSQRAEVSYGHHRLRVDSPGQRLIIDFKTGALTYVDVDKKQYAVVTLEEMVRLRDQQMKTVKARLDQLPEEMRKQMEAQMREAETAAKASIKAEPTGEERQLKGVGCAMYEWSGTSGDGQACIATKLPFDPTAFRKDSQHLSKRMAKLGAGSAASSMAILQLGEHGFPIMIEQQLRLGANAVQVTSNFTAIKAAKLSKAHFNAPDGFKKRDFKAMMSESLSAPPAMPQQ